MKYSWAIKIALLATLVMLTSAGVVDAQQETDMSKSLDQSELQMERAWSKGQSLLRADRILWIEHMHRSMLQAAIGSIVLDPRDENFRRIEQALLEALTALQKPVPYKGIVCPPGTCPDLGACTPCEPFPPVSTLEGITTRKK